LDTNELLSYVKIRTPIGLNGKIKITKMTRYRLDEASMTETISIIFTCGALSSALSL
jgi:hypothetical protein